tara:strand:- start:11010 stop:12017 length:1008 start_codon:yes stop_codon:yes gene_type:complete
LGHTTRIIPLIEFLIHKENEVVIAADGACLKYLKQRFPNLITEEISGYNIKYNPKNLAIDMLFQLPKLVFGIRNERRETDILVRKHLIDVVISDNRYGVCTKLCKSYFITHQLNIQAPFFQKLVNLFNHLLIKQFDDCWIPDVKGQPNLTNQLTKSKTNFNTRFIGPLSRFWNQKISYDIKYDCIIMISGPEPKRSIFEKELIKTLPISKYKKVGVISPKLFHEGFTSNYIDVFPQLSDPEFYSLLKQSSLLITRPGYTTVMDLLYTKTTPFFIPTKGQTEQEYLAKYYQKKGWANYTTETDFNWDTIPFNDFKFPIEKFENQLNIFDNLNSIKL